ncbi:hypothetical protein PIB30_083157 [Stylosanthes scabra]|uniref:Transposase (putative) gypsy type domain-containing protein n=1 Tax=Stylosanthes scabra TaxID=79078 RepID=A0ABU6QT07_9FABA|nr:hypothetical protein [Stylosanthes scabra]
MGEGGEKIKVELLSCLPSGRVCKRREYVAYYYVYVGVMADLKMKFPFTKFECQVLTQMNCAPSQLHPNSWAFIRAFEVLMEFLECQPTLGLFFSLFQVKGCWKGTNANLNSSLDHFVFALFRTSYKGFQDMFVKVRSVLEEFSFYVEEYLCPKFPLYWSCEPIKILDVENRTEFEELVLEFLTSTKVMEEVLSCAELMKWEDDSQSELKTEVCFLLRKVWGCNLSFKNSEQRVEYDCRNDQKVLGHGSKYCVSPLSLPIPVWMDCHLKETSHSVKWSSGGVSPYSKILGILNIVRPRYLGPVAKVICTLQPMAKTQGHYSLLTALSKPDAYALLGLFVCISSDMRAAQVWWVCTHRASGGYAPMLEGVYASLLQCVCIGDRIAFQAFLHDSFVPRALFSHFREKGLGLNSTSMMAFLRQRASRKEVSVSEVCKYVGGEGGYTSTRVRHVSIKRRKAEGVTTVADKIGEGYEKGKKKKMAIDEVEKAFKSQLSLHGYKGSDDLSLLWSEDYPFTALAEDYGQSLADVKLVTEAGAFPVIGPRMMSMGRTQEKLLLKMFE